MKTEVWDFVEKYYPNYHKSEEIALSGDLQLIVDGQAEPDSPAELYLRKNCDDNIDVAKDKLHEVNEGIYEKAIEAYLNTKPENEMPITLLRQIQQRLKRLAEYEGSLNDQQDEIQSMHDAIEEKEVSWDSQVSINIIEVASELAHKELEEIFEKDNRSDEIWITSKSGDMSYTEDAQGTHNDLYDKHYDFLKSIAK